MRTIAVANQKGGVGKTSIAVNLAAALGELGKRVLLVDLDSSGDASRWLGQATCEGLWKLFAERVEPSAALVEIGAERGAEGVWMLPASSDLSVLDMVLQAGNEKHRRRLAEMIGELPGSWDFVILDTPPVVGIATVNALMAADLVLIPVESRALGLGGLGDLLRDLDELREGVPRRYLACRITRTNLSRDIEEQLREHFGALVLQSTIREAVRLAEAPAFEVTILAHAPDSPVAEDFRELAREIEKGETWHNEASSNPAT